MSAVRAKVLLSALDAPLRHAYESADAIGYVPSGRKPWNPGAAQWLRDLAVALDEIADEIDGGAE